MSDPTRMISEEGEAVTDLERDLLRAGREVRLTPEQKRKAWLGLSAVVGAAVVPAAVSAPAAAAAAGAGKTLGAAALVKGTLLVVVLGGGSLVGYRALRSHAVEGSAPRSPVVAPRPAPAAPNEPDEPILAPAPEATRPPPARRAAPATRAGHDDDARRLPASHLAAEGRLVLEARRELREGDAEAALRRLEDARAEFADGALVQEREALTIEALSRAGRHDAAAARARAFLRAYPGSPHAASVRGFGAP